MKPAVLRLDSFSSGPSAGARLAAAAERDEAFQLGYEKGLAEGREGSLDALTDALAGLGRDMQASQQAEAALRRELRAALAPVLDTIVDLLGPRSEKERLRHALGEELARIVEHVPDGTVILRCPQDLQPDLADCIDRARFPNARIEPLSAGLDRVELAAGQGSIILDPSLFTAGLKAIIDDIKTGD